MSGSEPVIEVLTRQHLIDWYGDDGLAPTAKGFVCKIDGEVVGMAGLRFQSNQWVAFVDAREKLRARPAFFHRKVKKYLEGYKASHRQILAVLDATEANSVKWLRVLGFEEMKQMPGVWKWRQ